MRFTHTTVDASLPAPTDSTSLHRPTLQRNLLASMLNQNDDDPQELLPSGLLANQHVGDPMGHKDDTTTRFYFTNTNGIKIDAQGGSWRPLLLDMANESVDFFSFAEPNLNFHQANVSDQVYNQCKQQFHHFRLAHTTTPGGSTTAYLPGGVISVATGALTGRFFGKHSDALGRWTKQSFTCKQGRQLHVFTCYQPCRTNLQGTNTVYARQSRALDTATSSTTTASDPRQAFKTDLKRELEPLMHKGDDILLMGDFNETTTSPRPMREFITELGLCDLFEHHLGTAHRPTTHERGTKRIDYALCTPSLVGCIQNCGYEPFHYRFDTDHRGFYIDFVTHQLFGDDLSRLPPLPAREFTAKDPTAVLEYITTRAAYLRDHNIDLRVQDLLNCSSPNHTLAEQIDRDLVRSAMAGAKRVKKHSSTPWSPTLIKLRRKVLYLRIFLAGKAKNRDVSGSLARLPSPDELDIPSEPLTLALCKQELTKAYQALRTAITQAADLRAQFLLDRAEALAAEGDRKAATVLHQLKRAEDLANIFRKLRSLRKSSAGSLTRLQVPTNPADDPKSISHDDSLWTTLDTPDSIESALRERNQRHFGQAEGTPLTSPSMRQQLDFTGSTRTSELILHGDFSQPDLDHTTRLFLEHLQAKTDLNALPTNITAEEFLGKLKRWPETTSTSPSGMHLSHYHALFQPPSLAPDDDRWAAFKDDRDLIIHTHLALLNYATKWQYSFDRWKTIVNVMILKEPGNHKIHRLRVIHLYEADYNLLLSVKWRQAIHHAEDNHLLNEGMYGSRPGRTAHEPVFLEELQNEIYRTSFRRGMKMDLDATSCYDRILPSVAGIASRRMGVHKRVVLVNAKTLEEAEYYLKTTLGLSKESYRHCSTFPLYGTGQGSGNSPQLWCFVCSALFDAFESQAKGSTFISPDGRNSITIYMVGFVDDCSLGANDFLSHPQPSPQEILELLRQDCQLWHDLLWSSGGALELPKCSFHYFQTSLSTTSVPFQLPAPSLCLLIQAPNNNDSIPVPMLPPTTPHKTLGYYKSPAGTEATQLRKMISKAQDFAKLARTSSLTRREVWTLYSAIYKPSVGYALPCSHFSKKSLDKVDRAATGAFLNGCGFARNFPRKVTFGPTRGGGTGLRSLYCIQGLGILEMLLKHLRTAGQCQTMLHIALAWTQFQAGTSRSILADVTTPLPHSSSKWFMAARQFLQCINGSIDLADTFVLPPERRHDRHLMDIALDHSAFSPADLRMINHVRLHQGVTTISDLTSPCGRLLDLSICHDAPSLLSSTPKHQCATVPTPSKKARRVWSKFLRLFAPAGRLRQPLGPWLLPPTDSRRQWPTFLQHSRTTNTIWRLQVGTQLYRAYYLSDNSMLGDPNTALKPTSAPPGVPTTLIPTFDGFRVTTTTARFAFRPPPPAPEPTTFPDLVRLLPEWERNLLCHVELYSDPTTIVQLLAQGLVAASDGSVEQDTHGAAAWVLSTADGTRLSAATCHAPGHSPSSFRAEGYGILAILRFLIRLLEFTKTTSAFPELTIHTDSLSFIKRLQSHSCQWRRTYNASIGPNWDIINAVWISKNSCTIPTTLQWVKGHQDEDTPYDELPLPAQLNCDADRLAGIYQCHHGADSGLAARPIGTAAQLLINGRTIHTRLSSTVYNVYGADALAAYTRDRFGWSEATHALVDSDILCACIQPRSDRRTTFIKHAFNLSPTARITYRYGQSDTQHCPACAAPIETEDHIVLCPSPSRDKWRSAFYQQLDNFAAKLQLDDTFTHTLRSITRCSLSSTSLTVEAYPPAAQQALNDQQQLSAHQLFQGRWATSWTPWFHECMPYFSPSEISTRLRKLAKFYQSAWYDAWDARNSDCHGDTPSEQAAKLRTTLLQDLRSVYDQRMQMLPVHRRHLHDTYDAHLADNPSNNRLQRWLQSIKPLVADSVATAIRLSLQGVADIRQFFAVNPVPPAPS